LNNDASSCPLVPLANPLACGVGLANNNPRVSGVEAADRAELGGNRANAMRSRRMQYQEIAYGDTRYYPSRYRFTTKLPASRCQHYGQQSSQDRDPN